MLPYCARCNQYNTRGKSYIGICVGNDLRTSQRHVLSEHFRFKVCGTLVETHHVLPANGATLLHA